MKLRHLFLTSLFVLMGAVTACQRNIAVSPNPLALYTATPTSTSTSTFTFTSTFTMTSSFTQSFTPTFTLTSTPSFTGTSTPTDTPTYTETPTPSDTPTSSDTPTLTFTDTITFTPTDSPTDTPTETPTDTPTNTPVPGADWFQSTASAGFSGRYSHTSVVFNNALWVIGGAGSSLFNDVWSSTDGVTWNQATAAAPFSARYLHASTVYNSAMWVIGGFSTVLENDVWSSVDGVNWTPVLASGPPGPTQFSPRVGAACLNFNGLMWVIGGAGAGYFNDVWNSADGVTWTQVTPAAAFPGRYAFASFVYNNLMWVIGGTDDSQGFNDVWSSADGVTWTPVLANGPGGPTQFGQRAFISGVDYNGAMWIMGGWNGGADLNDVWTSTDGATWTEVTPAAAFSARDSYTSAVFDAGTGLEMWVIGGVNSALLNDVWHSP